MAENEGDLSKLETIGPQRTTYGGQEIDAQNVKMWVPEPDPKPRDHPEHNRSFRKFVTGLCGIQVPPWKVEEIKALIEKTKGKIEAITVETKDGTRMPMPTGPGRWISPDEARAMGLDGNACYFIAEPDLRALFLTSDPIAIGKLARSNIAKGYADGQLFSSGVFDTAGRLQYVAITAEPPRDVACRCTINPLAIVPWWHLPRNQRRLRLHSTHSRRYRGPRIA